MCVCLSLHVCLSLAGNVCKLKRYLQTNRPQLYIIFVVLYSTLNVDEWFVERFVSLARKGNEVLCVLRILNLIFHHFTCSVVRTALVHAVSENG